MQDELAKEILITERLILRTWIETDIPKMAAISSDPKVMDYFPYVQDLEETIAFVEHIKRHYQQYGYALYAVELKKTGEFIGFVGLNHVNFTIPDFVPKKLPLTEIGWRLAADYWGQGFATEAAKAVLHYAFTELDLIEVVSFTSVINQPSRRVMEKIGLRHDEKDDFNHPKIDQASRLYRHVLYHLSREQYFQQLA